MYDNRRRSWFWILNRAAIACIGLVSGFFRALNVRACRFSPTCSVYASEAFRQFSFWKACGLSLKRLLKCHPFCDGGYDPLHSK